MLNTSNLSDEQLNELDTKLTNDTLTEEERKALTPEEQSSDNFELVVEVDEDPVNKVDNSAPNPPTPQDNLPAPTDSQPAGQPPAPVTTPAVPQEVYDKLIAEHPQLAKFKNDENFLTNLSKSYVSLEQKMGKPQEQPAPPPITDEQKLAQINKMVLTEVERRMMSDPNVLEALTIRDEQGQITEILQLPKTPQEVIKFKREYPAEYVEIKMIGERLYDNVFNQHKRDAELELQAPAENQTTLDKFMDDVAVYCKKVAPNATADDLKIVGETMQKFIGKTLPDGKYYEQRGKGYFLNGRLLTADFLAENPELIGKLAEINAKNSV